MHPFHNSHMALASVNNVVSYRTISSRASIPSAPLSSPKLVSFYAVFLKPRTLFYSISEGNFTPSYLRCLPHSSYTHKRFAAGTIMKITYGHTVHSTDELYVRLAEEAGTDTITSGSPGSMLVDFFPACMS